MFHIHQAIQVRIVLLHTWIIFEKSSCAVHVPEQMDDSIKGLYFFANFPKHTKFLIDSKTWIFGKVFWKQY